MKRDAQKELLNILRDENDALVTRAFVHYDPATGVIAQTSQTQIPPDVPGTVVAVFTNITFTEAFTGHRVDLASVIDDGGDYPTCELVKLDS